MNRKFFNLLLMGALAVTAIGSVSSCKDYDDDINNLQKQIDQAALKTEVTALQTTLANVQSAATAAQAAADNALTKALGGQTAADGAQTTADEALAKAEEALATALAALPSTDATAIREALATINATAADNATKVTQAIQDAADAAAAAAAANTAAGNAQTSADAAAAAADEAKQAAADSAQAAKAYAKAYTDEQIAAALANVESTLSAVENDEAVKAAIKSIAQAQVNAAIPANLAEKLEGLQTLIDNAGTKEDIEKLLISVKSYEGGINALFTAVTGVSVVGSLSGDEFTGEDITVEITCGKVTKDNTLGKDDKEIDNATFKYNAKKTITYTKDTMFSYADGELLVRVNPTNVDLTTADIKFIDSKGNDLDDVIEVVNVEKYNGLLTRGSGNATGLWKVTMKSKKDGDNLDDAVTSDNKQILYAIGVNNTDSTAADRYVVSTYDVTFQAGTYEAPESLDNVKVKEASKSDWKTLSGQSTLNDGTHILTLNNGEEFQVSFADLENVEYFYVVRDDYAALNANNGASSEYNAWKNYQYGGDFGKVIAVNQGTGVATLSVTIPSSQRAGDEVQFRVYAVSYEGSLVAEQGEAFRVYVGTANTQASLTANVVAVGHEKMETEWVALGTTLSNDGEDFYQYSSNSSKELTLQLADETSIAVTAQFAKNANGDAASSNSEITHVKFAVKDLPNIQEWTDGAEATGTLVNYSSATSGLALNTINVSLTKVMPTAADARAFLNKEGTLFTWKAAQLKDGVYTAYLYPASDDWTGSATKGYKKMTQAIDNLPTTGAYLKIANAALGEADGDGNKAYDADLEVAASADWQVDVPVAADGFGTKLIDNTTKHDAVFGYNFGKISSVKVGGNYVDYKVDATDTDAEFKMIFANPLAKAAQSYAWATGAKNYLTYGNTEAEDGNLLAKINGTNTFDNTVFGNTMNKLINGGTQKYVSATAKLYTKGTKIEQYFKANIVEGVLSFTKVSGASNPHDDVESTLEITLEDAFGETHEYELPFTVKRAE